MNSDIYINESNNDLELNEEKRNEIVIELFVGKHYYSLIMEKE